MNIEDTRLIHLDHLLLLEKDVKTDISKIIQQIGHIQIDSIYVVARSQDLVLHSRNSSYKEGEIWKLQEQGKVFEEFAHARSILPIDEFPYYYATMIHRRKKRDKWFDQLDNPDTIFKNVLDIIEREGEITTTDLDLDFKENIRWGNPKRWILDYLVRRGYIQVNRRDNFSKIYFSLIEDVMPNLPDEDDLPDRMDVFWHDIFKTLRVHGIVPFHRLLHYMHLQRTFTYNGKRQSPRKLVKSAIEQGKIELHKIDGSEVPFYSLPEFLENYQIPTLNEKSVFLLSPFDNCMWSRESLFEQYNFQYKFEAYTPVKDRKYGFYTLPILYGTEFVGRVDPKFDRTTKQLMFKQWTWEGDILFNSDFWDKLSETIDEMASFHGATSVGFGDLKDQYQTEIRNRITIQSN